jgi:hypothetical protein
MARTKTKYRRFATGGAVPLHVEIDTPAAHIAADKATADLLPAIESSTTIPDIQDDASRAFQKQIDALRKSEQIQRERAAGQSPFSEIARATPEQLSRAQRVQKISEAGASLDHVNFLMDNPSMLDSDNFNATSKAHWAAIEAGHELDSPEYFRTMKNNFDDYTNPPSDFGRIPSVERETAGIAAVRPSPVLGATDLPEPRNRSSMVSAPVSRETASTGYNRDTPRTVRLSVAQREAARYAGISEREYAEQLLKLREEKANGRYGGDP